MTWMQPRLHEIGGVSLVDALALEFDRALGHVAALGLEQVGHDFSVVVLPAPLAPSSATMPPFGT
jgi:hypothetical protein